MHSRILGIPIDAPLRLPSAQSRNANGSGRLLPSSKEGRADDRCCAGWVSNDDAQTIASVAPDSPQPWCEWVRMPPIELHPAAAADETPLDRALETHLKYLESVFRRPRQALRTIQERLPLAQARRVPERAVQTLTLHPEDWERRTATGIQPLRILAQFSEDDLDLYENRVAVRLLDGLLLYVGKRIQTLQKRLLLVGDGESRGALGDAEHGGHWRNRRVFGVYPRETSNNSDASGAAKNRLRDRLNALQSIRRRLLQCQDRPLYRAVNTRAAAALGQSMRPTNILNNDSNYRKVAELWRAWTAHCGADAGAEERALRRQRESEAFDRFARLLATRALDSLGWRTDHPASLAAGAEITLRRGAATLALRLHADGAMSLRCGDDRLRLAPILCGLNASWVAAVEGELTSHCRDAAGTNLLVLMLETLPPKATDHPPLSRMRHQSRLMAGWSAPTTILVSPFEIDSQERLERALNLWLAPRILPAYGARVHLPGPPTRRLPDWLHVREIDGRRSASVRKPPSDRDLLEFRNQLDAELRFDVRDGRSRQQHLEADRRCVEALRKLIEPAERLADVLICPVCGGLGNFEPRTEGSEWTWWCRCGGCDSEWGTRSCRSCHRAYPVLRPGNVDAPAPELRTPDWIDVTYGRDLWSAPCADPSRNDAFRCCHCGSCGDGEGGCAFESR